MRSHLPETNPLIYGKFHSFLCILSFLTFLLDANKYSFILCISGKFHSFCLGASSSSDRSISFLILFLLINECHCFYFIYLLLLFLLINECHCFYFIYLPLCNECTSGAPFQDPKVKAEAEFISSIVTFFKRVGITASDVGFKVSRRKVLQEVLRRYYIPESLFSKVCIIIDKVSGDIYRGANCSSTVGKIQDLNPCWLNN